jgi:hypothetical protein
MGAIPAELYLPILIFMLVIGPAVGNYACSVVYRLPRGKTPFERHPFCGHCNADLQPKDLFPILSWFSTRGRCRYCKGEIPVIYTVIELACLALFVCYFLLIGIGPWFLLGVSYGVFVIILAAIQWQQGWVSSSIYSYAFLLMALLRTYLEGDIYPWIQSSFMVLVLCLTWQRLVTAVVKKPFLPYQTPWIWWMVLLAVCVPPNLLIVLIPAALVLGIFRLFPVSWRPWALLPIAGYALLLPLWPFFI